MVDRISLDCLRHSSDWINDRAGTIILNVVTATPRDNESPPRGKSSELLLQMHQGRLPIQSLMRSGCARALKREEKP